MYFKCFTLGSYLEKEIARAGFIINSYSEKSVFLGESKSSTFKTPKDYYFDGSIWKRVNTSFVYERMLLLARTPMLSFDELWNLYFNGNKDDSLGASIVIESKYRKEACVLLNADVLSSDVPSKSYLEKLKKLREIL